jgi:hemerythrin superfamily protein
MNAIDLIKDDHREVERLFSEFLAADGAVPAQLEDIFQQLERELLVHSDIEEQILYPAVEEFVPDEVDEALHDHQEVKQILSDLMTIEIDDEEFEKKLITLMEQVQIHVQEEEASNGILETARKNLSSQQLDLMARNIRQLKNKAEGELAA